MKHWGKSHTPHIDIANPHGPGNSPGKGRPLRYFQDSSGEHNPFDLQHVEEENEDFFAGSWASIYTPRKQSLGGYIGITLSVCPHGVWAITSNPLVQSG